ncbi:hypothetical protein AB6A40_007773 [Gnathostoma spinigerum]|uniref:Uncharacterized protein n=1 Tax=Gnathostoma spinigerum TaxID=75299 RepID=A0ABD6EUY0_9BILA
MQRFTSRLRCSCSTTGLSVCCSFDFIGLNFCRLDVFLFFSVLMESCRDRSTGNFRLVEILRHPLKLCKTFGYILSATQNSVHIKFQRPSKLLRNSDAFASTSRTPCFRSAILLRFQKFPVLRPFIHRRKRVRYRSRSALWAGKGKHSVPTIERRSEP